MTEYTEDLHARLVELDKAASPAPWNWEQYDQNLLILKDKDLVGLDVQDFKQKVLGEEE